MTLHDIARFLDSESADTYADVCREFGIDPAQILEDDDPFLAWQLRLGLAAKRWDAEAKAAEKAKNEAVIDKHKQKMMGQG